MAITFWKSLRGGRPIPMQLEMEAGISIQAGQALEPSAAGKLQKINGNQDNPPWIANTPATSTATGGERVEVVHTGNKDHIWNFPITPALNNATGQAGGSATQVVIPSPTTNYSSGDFIGGQVLVGTEQRTITASSAVTAPANITLTVTQPFTGSTVGKTGIKATPLGADVVAARWESTLETISQVISELTGGPIAVVDVDLIRNVVHGYFV
ncbi:MAG TPA: hypothetical protein EYN91_25415 [Candidatus Melainabacteria bacterium]|nr:hypothetical protein [Candidatus Melainabacteria bacterium]HIN66568.1 hypothetical protein [Candidatus Obscuribacterales bacterium]